MPLFADVILPLPLPGTFTYAIPDTLQDSVGVGSRVYVQFGRKKFYTAIVARTHDIPPEGYEVKEIDQLLDSESVIRYPQLKLWNWMADYYLCSLGDVYKAAIPAGMKIESETSVSLNPNYDPETPVSLTEKQAMIVASLQREDRLSVKQLAEKCDIANITPMISKLLTEGIVEVDERSVDKYRPEKKTLVRLTIGRDDDDALHKFFDMLTRSRVGEKILVAYLQMSGWLQRQSELRDVERSALLDSTKASPGALKGLIDKGILEVYTKTINRFNSSDSAEKPTGPAQLSAPQQKALSEIHSSLADHKVVLLRGVTGSGKTEIYTHLMQEALDAGNQVLYLVPEISLTTQLTDRLRKVFGDKLIVYHSKFSDNERVDIWRKVLDSHEPMIILGARSSLFLPFARLGLVIVDEEHESSFKQFDPAPRYNARDTAIMLATMHGAPVILGSATPSVETYYKANTGKYGLVELEQRYSGVHLPVVEIVDMKRQRKMKLNRGSLSLPLRENVTQSLQEKKQSIIFQNRRGFAPMVVCKECGWTPKCGNCDVSMVYHKNINQLRCHYCGFAIQLPNVCPACGLNGIETYGYGTERIAEEVHEAFPDAGVARMDLDTTRNKNAYQEIIENFAKHHTDILVGTQMVSKGLDFESVNTVGVINADTLLNFPDFRSDERAFNMLEQVAGRAGRRSDVGKVIIQTTDPDNSVLRHVRNHDYHSYYAEALADRKRYNYPPFTKIINIYLKHRDRDTVDAMAITYATMLRDVFGNRVLGPERPTIGRIANRYIQTIMLKVEAGASMAKVKTILRNLYVRLAADPRMKQTTLYYDVDPA